MVKQTPNDVFKTLLDKYLVETLKGYIEIKNTSSVFNSENNSELQNSIIQYFSKFTEEMNLQNSTILKLDEKNRTPVLIIIIEPSQKTKTNLIYGHFDKQPTTKKWSEGLSPYTPTQKENTLYGRGVSEGGFSFIASLLMLKALQDTKTNYSRTILMFETDKESGSKDLWYFYKKHEYILKPDTLFCLDGSVADYEHFYLNASFKGLIKFNLKVQVGTNDVHSGMGGGLVPDSYRIGTDLLEQFEDTRTGVMAEGFDSDMPASYEKIMRRFMDSKKMSLDYGVKFQDWYEPSEKDQTELFLKSVWRPTSVLTGFGNVPDMLGGNVLRGFTVFRTNLYLPPNLEIEETKNKLVETFKGYKPLYNAKVDLEIVEARNGFYNVDLKEDLYDVINECSKEVFTNGVMVWGTGESCGFLGKMQKYFDDGSVNFIVTGAKSFDSNSRSADENLNLDYVKKMLDCVLKIMIDTN